MKVDDVMDRVKGALPLTLGDWRALEKNGVAPSKLNDPSMEIIATILEHVFKKAHVTDLSPDQLSFQVAMGVTTAVIQFSDEVTAEVRPT